MIKQLSFPDIAGARVLTPMEMNNLHFAHADNRSPVKKPAGVTQNMLNSVNTKG